MPGTFDQPPASHVGSLRDFPRKLPTHVSKQVPAGPIPVSGAGMDAVRASLVWGAAELRADVRGPLLDATGMAAAQVRAAGRADGGGAMGNRGILDQFVYGRRGGGGGRSACGRRGSPAGAAVHGGRGGRGGMGGAGPCRTLDHPSLRGRDDGARRGRRPLHLAVESAAAVRRAAGVAAGVAGGGDPGLRRGLAALLQLPGNGPRASHAIRFTPGTLRGVADLLADAGGFRAGLPSRDDPAAVGVG